MQTKSWSSHDNRTTGVVDALSEKVLTETALLTLQHVGQRLQRAVTRASDRATATAVIKERINSLLQHPLFVVDNDLWRPEVE